MSLGWLVLSCFQLGHPELWAGSRGWGAHYTGVNNAATLNNTVDNTVADPVGDLRGVTDNTGHCRGSQPRRLMMALRRGGFGSAEAVTLGRTSTKAQGRQDETSPKTVGGSATSTISTTVVDQRKVGKSSSAERDPEASIATVDCRDEVSQNEQQKTGQNSKPLLELCTVPTSREILSLGSDKNREFMRINSEHGREGGLWHRSGEDNSGQHKVFLSREHSGHIVVTPCTNTSDSDTWENLDQHFWGILGDNTVMHRKENSGQQVTVDNGIRASAAAVVQHKCKSC